MPLFDRSEYYFIKPRYVPGFDKDNWQEFANNLHPNGDDAYPNRKIVVLATFCRGWVRFQAPNVLDWKPIVRPQRNSFWHSYWTSVFQQVSEEIRHEAKLLSNQMDWISNFQLPAVVRRDCVSLFAKNKLEHNQLKKHLGTWKVMTWMYMVYVG